MTSSTLVRPLLLLALALPAACAKDDESGTLTIEYELGPGLACDAPNLGVGGLGAVNTIRVTLTRGSNEIVEEAPCAMGDSILVASAPTGNYDLLVEGLDAVGDTVMDNLMIPADDEKIEVIGGTSQNVDVNLGPTPARIQVRFNIMKDGSFAQCAFADVQYFDLTAFRGATPMLMHQFDYCTVPPGYSDVPDPDRSIEGALLDGIRIDVLDDAQTEVASLPVFSFGSPGAGKLVQLTINCDNTDCSGVLDMVGSGGGDGGDGSGGSGGADDGTPMTTGAGTGDSTGGGDTTAG